VFNSVCGGCDIESYENDERKLCAEGEKNTERNLSNLQVRLKTSTKLKTTRLLLTSTVNHVALSPAFHHKAK